MIRTDFAIKSNQQMQMVKPNNQNQDVVERHRVEQQSGVNQHGVQGDKTQIDQEQLYDAVENLNKTMRIFDRGLEFSIHEDTNRIMVKVIDRSDHAKEEVIREIPPERVLDMIAAIMDMIGLLVDHRA